ncbi:hypothetical protein Q4S57_15460 [Priestia megaterium]|uniref:hypothetical protein n=1 Tax=Priestia megaterium TaxID=1404 RepID=UPI0026E2C45F|nr:hypothetical protein [Priestia megaterium]MDO6849353.1 hypothetical protein [Priestia megaterium]
MIGGQDEDSCGKSGTDETPQKRKRRGGSPAARGKQSFARKSTPVSRAIHMSLLIQFARPWIGLIPLCPILLFVFLRILKKFT